MMQYICVVLVLYVAMTSALYDRDGTLLDDITWPEYRRGCVVRNPNYIYVIGFGGYRLHTVGATWNEARSICRKEKAQLATVDSEEEAKLMSDIFKSSGPIENTDYQHVAFCGYDDLEEVGDWKTLQGRRIRYSKFFREPNDKFNNTYKRCGGINRDGLLDDLKCEKSFAFFCKTPYIKYSKCS